MASSARRNYSPSEQRILALLPDDGSKLTTTQLIAAHYGPKPPECARQSIAYMVRELTRKAAKNKEPFKVCRSEANGPYEIEFWLEQHNKK